MSSSPASHDHEHLGWPLIAVLGLLSSSAPLATDFYLPSLPEVRENLHSSASEVQLTITAFLVGLGIGQVIWGPISDRYGRLRPLLCSSVAMLVASSACVFAPNNTALIAARLVQALVGAGGVIMVRAIISDRMRGFAAARAFAMTSSINQMAPIIAPIAGGALAGNVPWRGILAVIAALTLVQLVGVVLVVKETLPPERRTDRVRFGNIGRLFTRPVYVAYLFAVMAGFSMLMAYVSSSTFVYQSVIGTPSWLYGVGFAVNACALLIGGFTSGRLAKRRIHPARTVAWALPLAVVAAVALLVVVLSGAPRGWLVVPLWFVVLGFGFFAPNIGALSAEISRDVAGVGSGVQGGLMFLAAGIVSPLGGIAGTHTAVPMAVTVVVCALLTALSYTVARSIVRREPHHDGAFVAVQG